MMLGVILALPNAARAASSYPTEGNGWKVELNGETDNEGEVLYTATFETQEGADEWDSKGYVSGPNAYRISKMVFGKDVTNIPNNFAFGYYESRLKEIAFEEGSKLESIGHNAFNGAENLVVMSLPEGLKTIGQNAFSGTKFNAPLPSTLTSISSSFQSCKELTSITIPKGVTVISGFQDCTALESVTILADSYEIDSFAFNGCTSLKSIDISKATGLGLSSFRNCSSLESVVINNDVENGAGSWNWREQIQAYYLESNCFQGCSSLASITFTSDIVPYYVSSNAVFDGVAEQGTVTIPTCAGFDGFRNGAKPSSGDNAVMPKLPSGWKLVANKHVADQQAADEKFLASAATCTAPARYYLSCSCGEQRSETETFESGDVDPDNHSGEPVWTQDAQTHRQAYACCGKVVVESAGHEWEGGACTVCDYECRHSGGAATCVAPATCEVCGEGYGDVDPDNHAGKTRFVTSERVHIGTCEACGQVSVPESEHVWNGRTCSVCGYRRPNSGGGGTVTPSYPVTSPGKVEGGNVSVSPEKAQPGELVTITATPDEGWQVSSVSVTDGSGNDLAVARRDDGTWAFTMPRGKVEVSVTFARIAPPSFSDVEEGAWYAEAVATVASKGLMTGYDNGLFGVGQRLTRGELATILWRNATRPSDDFDPTSSKNETGLSDVADGMFYTEAANWAVKAGVIAGYENPDGSRTFGADDPVTLEQLVTIMGRFAVGGDELERSDLSELERYEDPESVSDWAKHAVAWGTEAGLVSGYDFGGRYEVRGGESVLRERAATVLARAIGLGMLE